MSDDRVILGIDLGGTQVKGLAFGVDGQVLAEEAVPTNDRGDEAWLASVRAVFDALGTHGRRIAAVGLCAPGLAARDDRTIVAMPGRLRGLEHLPWAEFFDRPAVVLNDAHAALLGECWLGAARATDNALLLTLGTGVGGAAKVDGRLLRGQLGRAGHLGHISLNPDGAPDIVGTPGSLEDAIGECTLAARSGGRFTTTAELLAAVAAADREAREVWQRSVRALAAGLAGLINVFDPEVIVIGGGIAASGAILFEPLQAELDRMEWRVAGSRVRLVPAALGARAGAYGAAYRAREMLFST